MVCLRASDPCVVGDGVEASKIEQMSIPLVGDEGGWAPKDGSGGESAAGNRRHAAADIPVK